MHFKQLLYTACRLCISAVMAALLFPQISFCQITFFKTYGDTTERHLDRGYTMLQTEDGGYIAAGEYGNYFKLINHRTYYYGDVYLVKTNEYGDTLWTKTYGDTGAVREVAYSMDRSSDGGYIICAYDESTYKLWLIKIDSQGDSIWSKKYHVGAGNCIKKTNDDGYIITGGGINGESGIYLLKINSQGDILWLESYYNYNEGLYVQQTSDNGYIIASSGLFIKTDSIGGTLWTKIYPGLPHSICETNDSGYFIAGEYVEQPCEECELELHILLLRADSKGDTLWTRKINNGSIGDYAYAMKKTSDGGFIIAGETFTGQTKSGIYLLKLDEEGDYQWSSVISDKTERYRGYDVAETSDSGYIITGMKWWGRAEQYIDLYLVKVNDKGQLTGVNEAETTTPSEFELFQNYPNPFNPTTNIAFKLSTKSFISLKIFDALGREIVTLISQELSAGNYTKQWNAKGLPSGVYFYQISAKPVSGDWNDSFIETKKLILMK
jgi:hypothetical protein